MMKNNWITGIVTLGFLCLSRPCPGSDWAQFRGPNRDGKSLETGLLQTWPASGPALLWQVDGLGEGYSSAAVANGCVYTTGMIEGEGIVFAFDLAGRPLWKTSYGPEWNRSYKAARCTPTVEGSRLYVMSGMGVVSCLDAGTGDSVWSFDAVDHYRGQFPLWGMSENLLIDGNHVICTPGGKTASIIALDKTTGQPVWACEELRQASTYCNPRVFDWGTHRILVTMLRDSVVGLDADTGKLLWQNDFDGYHSDRKRAVNANAPLFHAGQIHTTSGYDNGGALLQLSADGTEVQRLWTDTVLDVHHGGVILHNGYLYGSTWTSNTRGNWACIRWEDGKKMYNTSWDGNKGSVIYAHGMLYCFNEKTGELALVPAKPDAFEVKSSFQITQGKGPFWAHPAISDGRLYVRHGAFLMVYDIKAK
ncbi:MAG: PQQ-binding-like beta-propeller repeat protein [Phycisphaerae bacterium]|nr:PQQ-binding-like beta-propeller repeat protein [Phycisphaerae bacterium]